MPALAFPATFTAPAPTSIPTTTVNQPLGLITTNAALPSPGDGEASITDSLFTFSGANLEIIIPSNDELAKRGPTPEVTRTMNWPRLKTTTKNPQHSPHHTLPPKLPYSQPSDGLHKGTSMGKLKVRHPKQEVAYPAGRPGTLVDIRKLGPEIFVDCEKPVIGEDGRKPRLVLDRDTLIIPITPDVKRQKKKRGEGTERVMEGRVENMVMAKGMTDKWFPPVSEELRDKLGNRPTPVLGASGPFNQKRDDAEEMKMEDKDVMQMEIAEGMGDDLGFPDVPGREGDTKSRPWRWWWWR